MEKIKDLCVNNEQFIKFGLRRWEVFCLAMCISKYKCISLKVKTILV